MQKKIRKFQNLVLVLDKKVQALNIPNQKWATFVALIKTGQISDQPLIHASNALMAFGLGKKACDLLLMGCDVLVQSPALLEKMVLTLREYEREKEAQHFLQKRIKADPQDWMATRLLARLYFHQERRELYTALIDDFIINQPNHIPALIEKATFLSTNGGDSLEEYLDRILVLEPDNVFALSQKVQFFALNYDFDAAAKLQKRLEKNHNEHALTAYCQGMIYDQQQDFKAALSCYNEALQRNPEMIEAYGKSGGMMIKLGQDLPEAWYRLEARFPQLLFRPDGPFWRGEDLMGKKLLIWAEQGIGDQISFASMLRDLPADLAGVELECEAKLVALFQRSFPDIKVFPRRKRRKAGSYDYHIPIGALSRYLRPDLGSFTKSPIVSFTVEEQAYSHWKSWLDGLGEGQKIGLCWRSGTKSNVRSRDAADLIEDLAPLLKRDDAIFINLFYGDGAEEIQAVADALSVTIHQPPALDQFNDVNQTAALIKGFDMVVGVACAPVRLAQAVGVQTTLLYTGLPGVVDPLWWPGAVYINRKPNEKWDLSPILNSQP